MPKLWLLSYEHGPQFIAHWEGDGLVGHELTSDEAMRKQKYAFDLSGIDRMRREGLLRVVGPLPEMST